MARGARERTLRKAREYSAESTRVLRGEYNPPLRTTSIRLPERPPCSCAMAGRTVPSSPRCENSLSPGPWPHASWLHAMGLPFARQFRQGTGQRRAGHAQFLCHLALVVHPGWVSRYFSMRRFRSSRANSFSFRLRKTLRSEMSRKKSRITDGCRCMKSRKRSLPMTKDFAGRHRFHLHGETAFRGKDEGRSQQGRGLDFFHGQFLALAAQHTGAHRPRSQHVQATAQIALQGDELAGIEPPQTVGRPEQESRQIFFCQALERRGSEQCSQFHVTFN